MRAKKQQKPNFNGKIQIKTFWRSSGGEIKTKQFKFSY
jgi:hypothetical protein